MATTTPNIGLTLPIGTENVSRQIINTNNTKIDTAIGTLNGKVRNLSKANANYITVTSLNDMKSKLIVVSNTPSENNTVIEVGIAVSYTSAEMPGWQSYYGQLNVITKGSKFNGTFTSEDGNQLTLSLSNSTWTIYSLNSKITIIGSVTYDIPNNTTEQTFDLPSGFNNGVLIGARCYSKYNTWVDALYSDGAYFGTIAYPGNGKFKYTANVAGNSTQIRFWFISM